MDELQKNNVDIDMAILSQRINYHFAKMNVNSFGRAMAYLTLVYLMNIYEDTKCEAVRLVAPVLRNMDLARVEESFFRRMFSWIRHVFAI